MSAPRAGILPKADQADGGPARDDARIAQALRCGRRTVERARQPGILEWPFG